METLYKVETKAELIIHVDSEWTVHDYSVLFDSINRLYNYYFLLNRFSGLYGNFGRELNWHIKFHKLPQPESLRSSFIDKIRMIFSNEYSSETRDIFFTGFSEIESAKVLKIKYGSKGIVDLAGIGMVFESIKDLIIYYFPNNKEKKNIELLEQEIIDKKIANFEKLGFNPIQIRSLLGLEYNKAEKLARLIEEGKIIDLEIIKESKN